MADTLVTTDPKSISPSQYEERFFQYLLEVELDRVISFLLHIPSRNNYHKEYSIGTIDVLSTDEHVAFYVSSQKIIDFDPVLGFQLLNSPNLLLPIFEETLIKFQEFVSKNNSFLKNLQQPNDNERRIVIKRNVHVRFSELPPLPEFIKPSIGSIRANEFDSLIQLSVTIVRKGSIRMLELSKVYQCHNPKCRSKFRVHADPEQDYVLPQPRYCPNMIPATSYTRNNQQGNQNQPPPVELEGIMNQNQMKKCNSSTIQEVVDEKVCVDYQEIKVQDRMEQLPFGSAPRSMVIILDSDLVDKFNPGDDVIIIGTLIRRWRTPFPGSRCVIDMLIQANNVISSNDTERLFDRKSSYYDTSRLLNNNIDFIQFEKFWEYYRQKNMELEGRNIILRSVCPQLYGLFLVKLSLLLALIGGSQTHYEGGVRRRSQIHLLMVGDPGCGKYSSCIVTILL